MNEGAGRKEGRKEGRCRKEGEKDRRNVKKECEERKEDEGRDVRGKRKDGL